MNTPMHQHVTARCILELKQVYRMLVTTKWRKKRSVENVMCHLTRVAARDLFVRAYDRKKTCNWNLLKIFRCISWNPSCNLSPVIQHIYIAVVRVLQRRAHFSSFLMQKNGWHFHLFTFLPLHSFSRAFQISMNCFNWEFKFITSWMKHLMTTILCGNQTFQ